MPHLCCERKSGGGSSTFCSASAVNQYAPNKVIEPIHLDINLVFKDLSSKTANASVTITLKQSSKSLVKSQKELSEITLNAENFENVKVSGEGLSNYRYDGHRIFLLWNEPFKQQEERKVTIDYELDDPIGGLYFHKGKEYIGENPAWVITDHETEKARYWLPTVDYPTVRTTLTWSITAPKEYISLANGTLKSSETKDGQTTTKWELNYPCPSYLVCFAVGDFIEVDDGEVDGIPIKYYAAKGAKPEDLKRSFEKTPSMIQWLQKKVGYAFPWPKYYQICLPAIRGAMENISLVTWTEFFVQDETFALEFREITDLVNIHEMGHTYFGDLLVISHFDHAWLKESWATYIEACYLQDHVFEDAFRYELYGNATAYFKECTKYMRPIVTRKYDSSWDMFDRHLYPGGSWRLHMLRQLLGDEAFWSGVQLYVQRFAKKTVKTSDFQNCLEEVSGLNLSRFFDEWLYSKGYPKLKGEYGYDLQTNRVKVVLTQTQVCADVPLFGFDLDVEITTESKETFTSVVHFDQEATVTTFIDLPEGQKPGQIAIDPDFNVLFSLDMASVDREVLIETAKNGRSVPNRIWAYSELIKSGSRPALKAVQELIKNEPFYGVRVQVAAALYKLNSLFGLEILAQVLDNEQDPAALFVMLPYFKVVDDNIRAALLRFLQREKLPYRAHGAALIALGYQRNDEDLKYLLEAAQDDNKLGQYGLTRSGALKALGLHRSEEAFKFLLNRVTANDEPLRARPGAIEGLMTSAKWQTEQLKNEAIEEISKLTRDPYPSVRMFAVEALVALKASSYCGKVSVTRSLYPEDDHGWLNRTLASLKKCGSIQPEITQQEETIKKLEDRLKKLEDKLARQEDTK